MKFIIGDCLLIMTFDKMKIDHECFSLFTVVFLNYFYLLLKVRCLYMTIIHASDSIVRKACCLREPHGSVKRGSPDSCRCLQVSFRGCLISLSVIALVLMFFSEMQGVITGRVPFNYELGGSLVNYSAGFVRRGLFGEIIQSMNAICQPIFSILVLQCLSLLFILYVFLARMIKLHIGLPFILAIVFSPSLILMHRGENLIRTDAIVIAINLAVSSILLHLLLKRNKLSFNGGGNEPSFTLMLIIDAAVFAMLAVSALIHELSACLLPPVMLIFFVYSKKVHRTFHSILVCDLLVVLYAVMMKNFSFSDSDLIAESWAGIYGNSDSFRYNEGLLSVVDKIHALDCLQITRAHLEGSYTSFIIPMLVAIFVPFMVLLASGITIFHSKTSGFSAIRCLMIAACLCPLGLCIAGNDFGRWFSLCAINITAYSLLIARQAVRSESVIRAEWVRKTLNIIKQCAVIVILAVLLNYRLSYTGALPRQPAIDYVRLMMADSGQFLRDVNKVITGDILFKPKSDHESLPWRQQK